jgi:hypothetical protein
LVLYWVIQQHGATVPAGAAAAGGAIGKKGNGSNLAGDIGAGACLVGGAVAGGVEAGPAGAAAGAKLGSALAPVCSYIGKEVAAGAEFLAHGAGKVAAAVSDEVFGGKVDYTKLSDADLQRRASQFVQFGGAGQVQAFDKRQAVAEIARRKSGASAQSAAAAQALVDRLTNQNFSSAPTPVSFPAANTIVVQKVLAVTSSLQSGAKSPTQAVASAVRSVLGYP